ncbi:MAG TPA: redoxin domain-containing protein [Methylomirabilota bacterium]|nr:redoxin domain-containing protein [Methylomirabilota bacterium]
MASAPDAPTVGHPAPLFSLPSVQGGTVELATYRGRANVVVWFSRGFTCPFCRIYMEGMMEGYRDLQAGGTEIIQVGPNLLQAARIFFAHSPTPYPFVCDPDKRLFAVYGLGDRGALEATRSAVVSFSYAFTHGDTGPQLRGAWLDVMNRNFVRRLHHHAMTALEQGIFLVDRDGLIRHRTVVGPTEPVPRGRALVDLVRIHCASRPDPSRAPGP